MLFAALNKTLNIYAANVEIFAVNYLIRNVTHKIIMSVISIKLFAISMMPKRGSARNEGAVAEI